MIYVACKKTSEFSLGLAPEFHFYRYPFVKSNAPSPLNGRNVVR